MTLFNNIIFRKHINPLLIPNQCLYILYAFIYKIYFIYIYPKAQAVSLSYQSLI